MGLLHKNLLFAGIASVAMVGFFGSSSASAIDGFSFSDVINNYRNQTEQLQSYLTNPFGSGCEATNPDSTISCNETPFPNLLYSASSKENLWGHDGKGIVFANNNNLVNRNPQLSTATRGDTLKFSVAIEAEKYYDDAKTDPIARYMLGSLNSCGLAVDRSSAIVKVNNQVVSADAYNVELYDIPKEEAEQAGYDFCNEFIVSLDWVNESDTPLYAEGSTIEFTYDATIEDDAPSEVFGRGVYIYGSKAGHEEYSSADFMTNTTFQATALLDGNIVIRRVDADGNPVAGAKYTVKNVTASRKNTSSYYMYDTDGSFDIFETDKNGEIVIANVPFGRYEVEEVYSPDKSSPTEKKIIKAVDGGSLQELLLGQVRYKLQFVMGMSFDLTNAITTYDDTLLADINTAFSSSVYEKTEPTFNADTGLYEGKSSALGGTSISIEDTGVSYKLTFSSYNTSVDIPYSESGYGKTSILGLNDIVGGLGSSLEETSNDDLSWGDIILHYNESDNAFHGTSNLYGDLTAFKDGDGYRLLPSDFVDPNMFSYYFGYDNASGKYYFNNYKYVLYEISNNGDGTINLVEKMALNYSPRLDQYYMSGVYVNGSTLMPPVRKMPIKTYATEYLFTPGKNTSPETITNPQTGDAVIKTIIITVAGLVPVLILRKRLDRR